MQDDQLSLDEVIKLINVLPQKKLPPLIAPKPSINLQFVPPKTLLFKPWSGKINIDRNYMSDQNSDWCIRQQIEGNEQENQAQENSQSQTDRIKEIYEINTSEGYFYKFQNSYVKLIRYLLQQNGFADGHNNKNWTIYWSSSAIKIQNYRTLLPYQKINHFPNSFYLTRKDLMNKCISKMQAKFGYSHFNFLPKTYILPLQIDQLVEQSNKFNPIYIAKPHNRSQGKGITVTDSLQVIYSKLQKYSSLIVSHYISNPLLINKLKFDLRIYVAITGVNPLRIYVYEEGLARFATQEYDSSIEDPQNKKFQHLTNYSINKKNSQFLPSNHEQYFGSKWSLTSLKDFLNFNIGRQQTVDLFQRIDDVIIKTIISAENIMYTAFMANVPYINNCFEVLGYDILIDQNLKPWLMEVNLSPSMNTDSQLDLKIKGNMIADLFTMIGITPLDQRYSDGYTRFQTSFYNRDQKQVQKGPIDRFLLKQIQNQQSRSGNWRKVFPLKNHRYKNYFQGDRYYNRLVREAGQQSRPIPSEYRTTSVDPRRNLIKKPKNIKVRINKSRPTKSFAI